MSKFGSTSLNRVPNSGGSNRVTLVGTIIRGGTGTGGATSVPCKEVWVSALSGDSTVKVRIGATCSATTGIKVPEQAKANEHAMYLRIPIDDLNKLYFFGIAGDIIDILYRC